MTAFGILVACLMFALLVRTLAQSYGERPAVEPRLAQWPDDPRLLTVDEVAVELDSSATEVMELVERGAIPVLVVPGFHRSNPERYRFDRDEIADWVIG